ncbi:hypothetical protein ACHAXR_001168, partial [Thalassiosira sp. AJA248-18]
KHREYRRKDLNWVSCSVEGALIALGSQSGTENKKRRAPSSVVVTVGGGSSNNNHSGTSDSTDRRPNSPLKKKRLAESNGNVGNTSQFFTESTSSISISNIKQNTAEPLQQHQQQPRSNSGGMLNASLRNRYKDVQREREKEAGNNASASEATDPTSNGGNAFTTTTSEDSNKDGSLESPSAMSIEDNGNASTAPNNTPSKPTTTSTTITSATSNTSVTPKKKKKTKKTPSKSASSSASNNRTQDLDNDSPYSSSATLLQPSPRPTERYSNLGGISSLLQQLRELIEYPLSHPELFLHLGVEPPRGVLLRGPPGCGKTHLAKAIAGELNVSYFQVSAPELVGGVSGESELRVRTLFESASNYAPAIIFIDEIDAIAPKRGEGGSGGGGKSMEKRIVAQLLTSMDSIHPKNTRNQSAVMVLGATNRPDAMDPALRRAGR